MLVPRIGPGGSGLILGQIALDGQDGLVMGVSFARRTGDTLRSRGLTDDVEPQLAAKIIFDYTDPAIPDPRGRMITFANGPFGGSPGSCKAATTTATEAEWGGR